ncbi:hypothetical protein DL93DRAFT_1306123 [Clavulina sp. PMI_390]|nr:hypothetical protein DL93DRAFT_1306123 [Clavulina sp. PMI_390]
MVHSSITLHPLISLQTMTPLLPPKMTAKTVLLPRSLRWFSVRPILPVPIACVNTDASVLLLLISNSGGIVLITFFWKFLFRGQCIRRADRETREERKERLSRHLICDNKMHQNYFTKQYDLIHQQTAYLALLISQTQPVGSLGVIRPAYPASHHQNDIEDTSYPPSVSSSGMEKSSNAIRRANRSDPEVSPWMIRHPEPEPASRCGAEGASPEHEEHGAVLPLAASPSRTSVISGSIATNTPRGSIATIISPPPGFSIERAKQDLLRPRSDSDSSSDIIFANLAD